MDWQSTLFQNWSGIFRTAMVGSVSYLVLQSNGTISAALRTSFSKDPP